MNNNNKMNECKNPIDHFVGKAWEIIDIKLKNVKIDKNIENVCPYIQNDEVFIKKKRRLMGSISKLINDEKNLEIIRDRLINLKAISTTQEKKSNFKYMRKKTKLNKIYQGIQINNEINLSIDRKITEEKKICSICLEETDFYSRFYLKCGHFFHSYCLVLWLKETTKCPVCRLELPIDFVENNSEQLNIINNIENIEVIRHDDSFFNIIFILVVYCLTWSLYKTIGLIKYVFI